MKIKTIKSLALFTGILALQSNVLTGATILNQATSAMVDGSAGSVDGIVGYTITGDFTVVDMDDIQTSTNGGGSVTFSFNSAVDFFVGPTTNGGLGIFDNGGAGGGATTNTFEADTGTWTFSAGSLTVTPAVFHSIAGDTATIGTITAGGNRGTGALSPNQDWGGLSISGVESVTWTYTDETNLERFNFIASVTVPEPSSSLLVLSSLGIFLVRRKRS